jgi:hypothetical protein
MNRGVDLEKIASLQHRVSTGIFDHLLPGSFVNYPAAVPIASKKLYRNFPPLVLRFHSQAVAPHEYHELTQVSAFAEPVQTGGGYSSQNHDIDRRLPGLYKPMIGSTRSVDISKSTG